MPVLIARDLFERDGQLNGSRSDSGHIWVGDTIYQTSRSTDLFAPKGVMFNRGTGVADNVYRQAALVLDPGSVVTRMEVDAAIQAPLEDHNGPDYFVAMINPFVTDTGDYFGVYMYGGMVYHGFYLMFMRYQSSTGTYTVSGPSIPWPDVYGPMPMHAIAVNADVSTGAASVEIDGASVLSTTMTPEDLAVATAATRVGVSSYVESDPRTQGYMRGYAYDSLHVYGAGEAPPEPTASRWTVGYLPMSSA